MMGNLEAVQKLHASGPEPQSSPEVLFGGSVEHPRLSGDKAAMKGNYRPPQLLSLAVDF
jgi:hypothetical protein